MNLLFLRHVLQESSLSPPALPALPEPDVHPPLSPHPTTTIFGNFSIGATVEISQSLSTPPDPPPPPRLKPKIPDHLYAQKEPRALQDRDRKIYLLQLKVKSLENSWRREKIKLNLAKRSHLLGTIRLPWCMAS